MAAPRCYRSYIASAIVLERVSSSIDEAGRRAGVVYRWKVKLLSHNRLMASGLCWCVELDVYVCFVFVFGRLLSK